MGKRSEKRMEVITDYMRHMGGLTGTALGRAWLAHWFDMHPRLVVHGRVYVYEKEIRAFGTAFQYADPNCFQKLAHAMAANAVIKRKKK